MSLTSCNIGKKTRYRSPFSTVQGVRLLHNMKFDPIYKRVLALWPDKILINDGHAIKLKDKNGKESYSFPTLNIAWDDAVEKIDPKVDSWGDMMVWTMFQSFHREAKKLLKTKEEYLITKNISKIDLEKHFRNNLSTEGWEDLRDLYEGN